MLIGYVSDERYAAIPDALVEIERPAGDPLLLRTGPSGALYADIPPGQYNVIISRDGYGSKRTTAQFSPDAPVQFRLLSDGLIGYVSPKWIRSGEVGQFKVHSTEGYRLSLWRYGLKKEEVHFIGWLDEHSPRATAQILPDGDFTQSGVQWNQHGYAPGFSGHNITAPARTGLYYFYAETESGSFFSFPWVVAPATPQAPIAILASTNTWNAYNNFGGRSNYVNATALPPRPSVNSRQDIGRYSAEVGSVWKFPNEDYTPLSFERPEPYSHIPRDRQSTDPVRGRQAGHLAEAEWRMLSWLEREDYAYDFYSDHQLHTGVLNLSAYKVLIISTHPEYWSRQQYDRVKDWVLNAGGKLLYLGGNGIDCEVVFDDDGHSIRFLTHYPDPVPGRRFTDPETGALIECRFQLTTGESPAALLGVVFEEAGIGTGAPYRVTDETHWIFHNTGLKNGDLFGIHSLHERSPGGASGHETDKRSPSSPANTTCAAIGLNPDNGGAELVTVSYPCGGEVFSAGSITWTSSIMIDDHISTITKNVLDRYLKK